MARKVPGINTGSSADISFLLLTFFLLTSSINTEQGIPRRLPPPATKEVVAPINQRNILNVIVNFKDEIFVNNEHANIAQLKDRAKDFLANPYNIATLPEKEIKAIENLGEYPVSKGVISITNDDGTTYDTYIQVQNELQKAINELRDELSINKFGKKFDILDTAQQNAIKKAIPMNISEAPQNKFGSTE